MLNIIFTATVIHTNLSGCTISIQALQKILKSTSNSTVVDLKPYRILISLLEKPEIGPVILDDILIDVFR